jgi:hypothetical protein
MGRTIYSPEITQKARALIPEPETTTAKKGPKDMKSVRPNSPSILFCRHWPEYTFHRREKNI